MAAFPRRARNRLYESIEACHGKDPEITVRTDQQEPAESVNTILAELLPRLRLETK
jgi:hypothetical protein